MKTNRLVLILVLVGAACTVGAQVPPPLPHLPFSINDFTSELTLLVARVDGRRHDPAAAPGPGLEALAVFVEAQRPVADFFKDLGEAGVEDFYLVCGLDSLGFNAPFFLVAPNRSGNNPERVGALLEETFGENALLRRMEVVRLRGALVAAAPHALNRLRSRRGTGGGADWEAGFAGMHPSLLQLQLHPYDGWQRVVEELMPVLPEGIGGGPSTALTRGLGPAELSLDLLPDPSLRLEIRSESRSDAEALRKVVAAGLNTLAAREDALQALSEPPAAVAALTPAVEGDGLVLELDSARLNELMEGPLSVPTGIREGTSGTSKRRK